MKPKIDWSKYESRQVMVNIPDRPSIVDPSMKDQIKALERVLGLIKIKRDSYDKRSQEELAANNPLQYAGFCFVVSGIDAAMSEIWQEISLLKRHQKRHKK